MANLYNAIFEEVFNSCSPIAVCDFNQIKGISSNLDLSQNSPIISFCASMMRKMFDEMIKVLKKARYNGKILLPKNIYIDKQTGVNLLDCVQTSHSAEKKYIIINDREEIILTYPKMDEKKQKQENGRIIFLPIDGLSSFAFGVQDFVILLAYQELDEENNFQTHCVAFYNPITKDLYNIDQGTGCSLNGKKLANDSILQSAKELNSVFVNNYELPFSFDINKVVLISNTFLTSTSIFLSMCNLLSTNSNLIIYKKGKDEIVNTLIEFFINNSPLQLKMIGNHMLIGTNKVIENIKK